MLLGTRPLECTRCAVLSARVQVDADTVELKKSIMESMKTRCAAACAPTRVLRTLRYSRTHSLVLTLSDTDILAYGTLHDVTSYWHTGAVRGVRRERRFVSLLQSAANGDVEAVQLAVRQGAEIDQRNYGMLLRKSAVVLWKPAMILRKPVMVLWTLAFLRKDWH
eukprot:1484488-Rhodomonas_salina.2